MLLPGRHEHRGAVVDQAGHGRDRGRPGVLGYTIFGSLSQTDDIGLFEDFSGQAHRTIASNLLAGGGYSIYAGATSETACGTPTGIVITGNVFATTCYPAGGACGPVAYYDHNGTGSKRTANTCDTTGTTIPNP